MWQKVVKDKLDIYVLCPVRRTLNQQWQDDNDNLFYPWTQFINFVILEIKYPGVLM